MSQSFAEALSWVPVSATFSGTLGRAHEYARAQGHRTVTLEHLLLALADDPDANTVLQASNIDIARVMSDASTHLGHHEDRFAPGQPVDPGADEALVRILDYAAAAARQSRRREINGAIVLAAIVGEGRSVAASMLQAQGLTFEGAIKALQRPPATQAVPRAAPQPAAAAPSHPIMPAPVTQPATARPPADPPAVINGTATQTNEEILASVRRRIDANRNTPKTAPVAPPREPYPQPPVTAPVRQAWEDEPHPIAPVAPVVHAPPAAHFEPPVAAKSRPAPMPVEPVRVQETIAVPSPAPMPAPIEYLPPPRPPEQVAPPPAAHSYPADDEYTGIYPSLPDPVPPTRPPSRPFAEDDGLRVESYDPHVPSANGYHGLDEARGPRRPPPIPGGAPPQSRSNGPVAEIAVPGPRPRQLGAPVVPPSTVAWPEPVRPQPAALPTLGEPQRLPRGVVAQSRAEPDPYDGGIAGAPYPEPDSVPPRPIASTPAGSQRGQSGRAQVSVEDGQLAENIPRSMRVGQTEIVEVRIARADVHKIQDGMQGMAPSYLHDLVVTKAMSVRLRAVGGSFQIEPASPETQWLDNRLGQASEDFASWRWNITPLTRGTARLQLVVSARTVASDGLSADTVLPDQVIDIEVGADYQRLAKKAAGWAGLMLLGGLLSRIGQGSFETVAALWRGFQ